MNIGTGRRKWIELSPRPGISACLLSVLFLLSILIIIGAAQAKEGDKYPVVKTDWGYFSTTVIKETNGALTGGVDSGDVDNDGQNELVIGSWSHEVYIVKFNEKLNAWDSWVTYTDDLDLLECSVGDIDNDGRMEILTGGYSKDLIRVDVDGKASVHTTIYEFDADIWDIQVGDLIPSVPGNEVAVAHWQNYTSVIYRSGGTWLRHNLSTKGAVTTLEIGEFDSEHPGLEFVTGSEEGYMEEFYWENGSFSTQTIYKENRAIRNVDIGDFGSYLEGNEIIGVSFSMNAGNATMVYGDGDVWGSEDLYNSSRGLEALGVGDMNPEHPGVEAVFAGYANTVTMIVDDGLKTRAVEVWKGNLSLQSELSGVVVDDIHPLHPGGEAYVVGYNGKVRMVAYDYPGADLDWGLSARKVSIQKGNEFPLHTKVRSRGGFEGGLTLEARILSGGVSVDPAASGIAVEVKPASVSVTETAGAGVELIISAEDQALEGEYTLEVVITAPSDDSISDSYSLPIHIVGGVTGFSLDVIPKSTNASTTKGFNTAMYQISVVTSSGTVSQSVALSLSGLPSDTTHGFSNPSIAFTETSLLTITVEENAKIGSYPLTIVGMNGTLTASTQVTLNIIELAGRVLISDLRAEDLGGGNYRLTADIENQGNLPLGGFKALFLLNDEPVYNPRIDRLDPGETTSVSLDAQVPKGDNRVSIYLEQLPPEVIVEGDGLTITIGEEENGGVPSTAVIVILIVIALVFVVAVIGVAVFFRSREPAEEDGEEGQDTKERDGGVKFRRTGERRTGGRGEGGGSRGEGGGGRRTRRR